MRTVSNSFAIYVRIISFPCYRFVTEGILLRELELDPLLGSYAAVLLDDVHERSIQADLLMGQPK